MQDKSAKSIKWITKSDSWSFLLFEHISLQMKMIFPNDCVTKFKSQSSGFWQWFEKYKS